LIIIKKNLQKLSFKDLAVWNIIFFGFIVVLITEIFSLFNLINQNIFRLIWFLIVILFFIQLYFLIFYRKKELSLKILKVFSFRNIFIFFIFITTFLTAVLYPPNTWDSMVYHLPKVMQWIQNQNVNFFPTPDVRQLIMPPLSEYFLLNFYLIFNNDVLFNLAQWFSMLFTAMIVPLITRQLGGNKKAEFFSLIFVITLPMGILQSSSTQTDYVTSLWLVCFVYFFLKYNQDKKFQNIIGLSVALGLSILTKPTAYLFALPFCIWLFLILIKNPNKLINLITITSIFLIINIGHFLRNISIYNNPIGINNETFTATNEKINILVFFSNLIRNIVLNLSFPISQINEKIFEFVSKLHSSLGISLTDQSTTVGIDYFIPFSLYESTASNTLHFLLIILSIIFFIFINKKILYSKNLSFFIISIILGFFIFSIVLKWQPYGNRLILPLFALAAPFTSIILSKKRGALKFFLIFLFLYSIPYTLFNKSRPLIASITKVNNLNYEIEKPYLAIKKRDELYFVREPELYINYKKITQIILENKCNKIGLYISTGDWEYPLWKLIKNEFKNYKIFHVNVDNSSKYLKYNNYTKLRPCMVIKITDADEKNVFLDKSFSDQIYKEPIRLYFNKL